MSLWDWFLGYFPISPDRELEVGDVVKQIDLGENEGIIGAKDDEILSGVLSASNTQIEDEVYKQTGARIKLLNRDASVVESGWQYHHTYEYKIEKASPIAPLMVVAILVPILAAIVVLVAIHWSIDSTMLKIGGTEISLGAIIVLIVIGVVAAVAIKAFLD
jgi:hypothetical protein